jgi:hypothetical protein
VRTGRGLIRDLRQLRLEAHEASGVRLPGVLRRLSAGEEVDAETEVPLLEYDRTEIGEVGRALDTLHRAAVEAAVRQARLRAGVAEVFVNLARRSQVLLHKQLTLLDTMERRTEDTEELADLFRLDHLTTRMRRHAEGLVILSGAAPSRQWRKPVQLMDVVRAAVAEVEDYERIEVRRLLRIALTGPAVADLTHLVAELLENATVFSPPHTAVQVLGERVANGFTLEIHDRGLGMSAETMLDANLRLAGTPEFELSDTDRLGLFVVSRLAKRQNVRVSLQPSPYGGTTAVVFIPDTLLTDDVPDTNGTGFRLDRLTGRTGRGEDRRASRTPVRLPGQPDSLLDGPVEPEAPVDLAAVAAFEDAPDDADVDEDSEHGALVRPRRTAPRPWTDEPTHDRASQYREDTGLPGTPDPTGYAGDASRPATLPSRRTPELDTAHGRPVTEQRARRDGGDGRGETDGREQAQDKETARAGRPEANAHPPLPARRRGPGTRTLSPAGVEGSERPPVLPKRPRAATPTPGGAEHTGRSPAGPPGEPAPDAGALPRRVRQASLAPRLKETSARHPGEPADPVEHDADEVRSRMASLQRGWRRGREENAVGEDARDASTARGTTKGDGR